MGQVFESASLEKLSGLAARFPEGVRPSATDIAAWTPAETLVFLQRVPRPLPHAACAALDGLLRLSTQGNWELLAEWLAIAAASDYEPAFPRLRDVLGSVGRMKYLRPLYNALGATPRTRALAREIYAGAKPRMHVLSRRVVESVLAAHPS